jgi:hypothetical protein
MVTACALSCSAAPALLCTESARPVVARPLRARLPANCWRLGARGRTTGNCCKTLP